ncbi:MAG: endonuclease/exonuclease/phosphatase family protein [Clostridia bacterium]|nr:endonuclease/exonuclease/phosphatase family protein [Clostridia bacterium]
MNLRVMSFNTLHCEDWKNEKIDFDLFAQAIKGSGADIIGLQEIRGKGTDPEYDAQAKILSEKTGYYYYFAKAFDVGGENPYGNAILSKYPIKNAETIKIPDIWTVKFKGRHEPRCILKAEIDIPGGLTVLVAHFGLNEGEAQDAVQTILLNRKDERCILMGDFNVTPDNVVLTPLREAMKDAADLFEKELLSWPADNPDRKIDYIFCSRDIKILSADIPEKIVSDHRPHIADIEL